MSEESVQVLRMLAEGTINVDDANRLLEALGEEAPIGPESTVRARESARKPEGTEARFTLEQIIELSEHEVDPAYIKQLREAGLADLSVQQIIELSEH